MARITDADIEALLQSAATEAALEELRLLWATSYAPDTTDDLMDA